MRRLSGGPLWAYIELMRPTQWYKNVLLFIGIVFSKNLGETHLLLLSILGFLSFCALSAFVYTINDIIDRDRDKAHPRKANRPIPSGRVTLGGAAALGVILAIAGISVASYIGWQFLLVAFSYIGIAISYSFTLKNIVIIDAICVAAGFVIRAIAGAVAISAAVSPWMIICVFLLAMFLTFGKRRHELSLLGDDAKSHRDILKSYSIHMTDDMITVSAATLIMAYSMWTFLATENLMMFTIPFAIYGLLRYMFFMHMANEGGRPEKVFKDLPSAVNILLWGLTVFFILYLAPKLNLAGGG